RATNGLTKGNVVVLPGIMGSELSVESGREQSKVWLNYWYIYRGYLASLELDSTGTEPATDFVGELVTPTGLLNDYYGKLLIRLHEESFNVRAFPYDWRLSIAKSAERLAAFIQEHFPGKPVTLVAHSMGGLVSRLYMSRKAGPRDTKIVERL